MHPGVRAVAIRETMFPFDGWRDVNLAVVLEVAERVPDMNVRLNRLREVVAGNGR